MSVKITGTGSYIPSKTKKNKIFLKNDFFNSDGSTIKTANNIIVEKFKAITGIDERRYAKSHLNTSDLAYFAALKAIEDANVNPEELDYIILAHNFRDINNESHQSDLIPCLASRVKHSLRIKNTKCIAYDILFGCSGWVQGVIQEKAYIKAGIAKKCLIIGSETLSRVLDIHDRDSMIYPDGAGAAIIEASNSENTGILSFETASYTYHEAYYIFYGNSNNKNKY